MVSVWQRAREGARFVVVTLVITLAYLSLQQLWLSVVGASSRAGLMEGGGEARLAEEARQLATQSTTLEAHLPSAHRVDAWRLGFLLGYSTEWLGSFAFSSAERQRQARQLAAPMLTRAGTIAGGLGLGTVAVLPVRSAEDFGNLTARVEADESGIAQRVETRLSPRDRHLFLLGMHIGIFVEALDSGADKDPLPIPQTALISRHATLAGVAPQLWKPLGRIPAGSPRSQIVVQYRAVVTALDAALDTGRTGNAPEVGVP